MGKPAARLGDMTAHGGSIVVGFPMVLIGGMPAARIGDMHVCPMVTPAPAPIPHVGGPVTLGSPTVLIGGMPAARMGDMCVCTGPPDTIAIGCPTVLIGEAGSGSGGGGGGGGGGGAGAKASSATALSEKEETVTKEEHWVELTFTDSAGLPVSGVPYRFKDPSGKASEAVLRLDGTIRRDGIKEGSCEGVLMDVSGAKWSKKTASVGEAVTMSARVEGFENGTKAVFQVFKRDIDGPDVVVDEVEKKISGGSIEATWRFEHDEKAAPPEGLPAGYSDPTFIFEVVVERLRSRSDLLRVTDVVEIQLLREDQTPARGAPYVLRFSNGEVRRGKLDGSGKLREEDVPPVPHEVSFPDSKARPTD